MATAISIPPNHAHCLLKLDGTPLSGTFEAEFLDGASPDSHNSIEHPDAVVPHRTSLASSDGYVDIPPHSVCVLRWH